MRVISLFTGCLIFAACIYAAPLTEQDASTADRDKRSGEVIFFENEQQGGEVNKRSDNSRQWVNPWYNGKNTDADADKKSEADTLPEEKQQKLMEYSRYRSQKADKQQAATELLKEEEIEQIEEKAFYQALDFLVDRLIEEAYEDESVAKELGLTETEGSYQQEQEEEQITTTILPAAAVKPVKQQQHRMSDSEALQLASLIGQQNNEESHDDDKRLKEVPVQEKAGDSEIKEENSVQEQTTQGYYDDQLVFDGDAEQAADSEDDEYTFDDIIGYLEYLKSLQTLESKLKLQLEEEGQQLPQKDTVEEKQGEDTPPQQEMGKIRRKRSMDGWSGGVSADRGGVFFSADEVKELKDLLLELAKERIDSQEIIDYLSKQQYKENPSAFEEDDVDETGEDFYSEVEVPQNKLKNLALRLNTQSRDGVPSSLYQQQYRQAANKRSSYIPYQYMYKK